MANAGSFKKGEKRPNQGKRGPGKLTQTVKEAFEQAFKDLQGKESEAHLLTWARENPTDFYRIAAKLIPNAVEAEVNGQMSHSITKIVREIVDPKA